MRTFLTIVGITLAAVIVAVAGVYGWMMTSAPSPSDKLPVPQVNAARQQPRYSAQTPAPRANETSPSDGRRSQTPNAIMPPSSRDLVRPTPPPRTQVADPNQGYSAPAQPLPEPEPPAGSADIPPAGEPSRTLETMEDKLYALAVGQSEDEAAAIMGERGVPTDDGAEFVPQGWYQIRWREADGAAITATFDEYGALVHINPFKVPGAFEWMTGDLNYSIVTWLNENLEKGNLPVRVPAVRIAEAGENHYQFQAGLVLRGGRVTGTIAGSYYDGDGETTYVPGDPRPYVRAMEGSYQYYAPDGAQEGNTFALAEY